MKRLKKLVAASALAMALMTASVSAQGYYIVWSCTYYHWWYPILTYGVSTSGYDPSNYDWWLGDGALCQYVATCDNGVCS